MKIKHLIILIIVLSTLLILPFIISIIYSVYSYHYLYITKDEIEEVIKKNINETEIEILGEIEINDSLVVWCATDSEIQPILFHKKNEKYDFYDHGATTIYDQNGIYVAFVELGFCFLITNPECATIVCNDGITSNEIAVTSIPFVVYEEKSKITMTFWDKNGIKIQ